jgi:uncharacterized protein YabE (DUF348 family)
MRLGVGVRLAAGLWARAGSRRLRLQVAGSAAIASVLLLALLLPSRTVRIAFDGGVTTTTSHNVTDEAVVEGAGVALARGDRVAEVGDGTLAVRRAVDATISVDGRMLSVRAQAESVAELLAQAAITLGPDDRMLLNGEAVALDAPVPAAEGEAAGIRLEVRRAVPFTLIVNGQEIALRSSADTLAAALDDAGVPVGAADRVQPLLSTRLSAGLQVHVRHATPLVVTLPEGKAIVYTVADTVGEAIASSHVALPADYRLEPAASTPMGAGIAVHVIGISEEQVLETERIESSTVYVADPSLPWGAQRVVAGQDGVHYWQYETVYEDGVLVSRELASEWYDPEPVDTIIYYSTAAPAATGASVGSWRDLVCSYGWDCDWALAVIACESGGNPGAYNPAGPFIGLFQIWAGHGSNLNDPATNIAAAYSLYLSGGRGHWPNCP